MVKAAGILTIIAGCYGIGVGAAMATVGGVIGMLTGMPALGAIGGGAIGLGIVALIGGIFALRRRTWGFALTGTILAIPLFPVGTVLGIISLIFVAKRKGEFA
jgi:hypothetical protein